MALLAGVAPTPGDGTLLPAGDGRIVLDTSAGYDGAIVKTTELLELLSKTIAMKSEKQDLT